MQNGAIMEKNSTGKTDEKEKIPDFKDKVVVVEGPTGEIIGKVPVNLQQATVSNASSPDLMVTQLHASEGDFNLKIVNGRMFIYK